MDISYLEEIDAFSMLDIEYAPRRGCLIMPKLQEEQIRPLQYWQPFQQMCCDLWRIIYNDRTAQEYGRLGHRQNGVDIFGRIDGGDKYFGIQCKEKNILLPANKLSISEIKREVGKAMSFSPKLSEYIIAYTGPTDKKLQDEANRLTEENRKIGLFSVSVCSWDIISGYLSDNINVYNKYYKDSRFPITYDSMGIFAPLSTLMERSNEFKNYQKLIDSDQLFLLEKEINLIEEIETVFIKQKTEQLFMLEGKPAKGKTVIACIVGKRLEINGYKVFYLRIDSTIRFETIWNEMNQDHPDKTLFILDDCHLNIDIASRLYLQFPQLSRRSNISCLMISTTTDEEIQITDFGTNLRKDLIEHDQYSSLDELLKDSFGEKIVGIASKRKARVESESDVQLEIGDEKELIANTGENLINLDARFVFWNQNEPLSKITNPDIYNKMYGKYLYPFNPEERNILLQIAALGKYEIRYHIPQVNEDSCETLKSRGLCTTDASGLISEPRGSFASLLIDSFTKSINFKSSYKSVEEFYFENYRNYIKSFPIYPFNIDEVIKNLLDNKAKGLLDQLFHENNVKDRVVEFYKNESSIDVLINFLFRAKRYLEADDIQCLTVRNEGLREKVLNSSKPILSFVKLLKTLKVCHNESYIELLKQFDSRDHEKLIHNSHFYVLCYSIHSLQESNAGLAKNLLIQVSLSDFSTKIKGCSLDDILQ